MNEKIDLSTDGVIPVTKAFLPNKLKYHDYVNKIFESGWLTNNGRFLKLLEQRLANYLGVKHLICVANGSLALQLAYKALDIKDEVITTPFSFAATASTLAWEGLTPVFADIDPTSFNLDPSNIEALITDKTSCILPVHVFGNPCQLEAIEVIAKKHNLKVIYDAAHAFGTDYTDQNGKTQSVLNYGHISTLSFHATKLFHTIEGGAVITNDDELARKIRLLMNFGITGPTTIDTIGTNAKMNEFEAAMGLCVLDEIEIIKTERQRVWHIYQKELSACLNFQQWNPQSQNNHAYAPVLFKSEQQLLKVEAKLKENDVFVRRYFFPSLDTLSFLKPEGELHFESPNYGDKDKLSRNMICKISRDIASRILCLPLFTELSSSKVTDITDIINLEMEKI